jgi:hypothetical protein
MFLSGMIITLQRNVVRFNPLPCAVILIVIVLSAFASEVTLKSTPPFRLGFISLVIAAAHIVVASVDERGISFNALFTDIRRKSITGAM